MQVEISEKAKATLDSLLNDGAFASEAAALDAALELLAQRHAEWWEKVAPLVEEGRRSLREGRFFELTEENKDAVVADIVARGRERLRRENAS